jgi:hypothetical protein
MASLLHMALEGQLGGILGNLDTSGGADNQSGQPTGSGPEAAGGSPEKDMVVLKGPLAVQFSEALARIYNKHASDRQEEAQEEESAAALESQANDALTMQELASNIQVMSQDEAPDNSTTVYGVDAADVKPEDVVEVSQDLDGWSGETPDFVLVMDTDKASVNGQGGSSNAVPEINQYGQALEAMCLRKGVPVHYSFKAYAQACRSQNKPALEGVQ